MSFRRMSGWAGVIGVALSVVGFLLQGTPPDADAPASEVAKYIADTGSFKAGTAVSALAMLFIAAFVAGFLMPFFKSDREHNEAFGALTLLGAVFSLGASLVGQMGAATLALRDGLELDAAVTRAIWDLGFVAYGVAILFLVVFAGGAAMAIQKRKLMPVWFGYMSWVVAVLGFTGIFGLVSDGGAAQLILVGFLALLVWLAAGAVVLIREPAGGVGSSP